jgi:predicted small lipoprotein YifL
MKQISFLLLLLALTVTACGRKPPAPLGADAPADHVPEIIGAYALNAEDATHERYGGSLFITTGSQPGEYNLQWLVSGDIQEGVGTLEGNQLTFTWKSVEGTDQHLTGYGVYTVTVNGELYGERFVDGVDQPGTESAYPNPK